MDKLNLRTRYFVLLLINAIPMVLNVLLFRIGGWFQLVGMLPCLACLTRLNFKYAGIGGFTLLQGYYALCRLIGGYVTTMLYTRNVSDDQMSYVIGQLFTVCELIMIFMVTCVAIIIKIVAARKKKGE